MQTMKEIESMKKFMHGNIVKFKEHFEENNRLCIVMEYCDADHLGKFIMDKQSQGGISEDEAIFYTI